MKEVFHVVSILLAAGMLVIGLPYTLLITYDFYSCKTKAGAMGFPMTWGPVQGCMIEYAPGHSILLDKFRAIDR